MEQTTARSFVRTYLPWLVAAGALLLYCVTLSRNISVSNIIPLARATGLDWHPIFVAPLNWLVTYPVRWLPSGAQLIALNLMAAACAALSLALLARSVAILPHDRTHEQRLREQNEFAFLSLRTAWIAPLFAVLICGLQLSFWEHAISWNPGASPASPTLSEMLDLLLFAYVIRCLLEFRLDQKDRWLFKLALVYGMGVANNFAFIVLFPAVLVALVWIKGLRFFEFSFLTRALLFGLAGLLLYLVLPLAQQVEGRDITFWQALKGNLGFQKYVLTSIPRWIPLWLGGYAVVLMLIIGIRWSSGFGDVSTMGSVIGTLMVHIVHLGLLAFVVYMLFDPPGSPRHLGYERLGLPFLLTYYMAALAAGYFVGYLLLVFRESRRRSRLRMIPFMRPLGYLITAIVYAGVVAVPAKLVWDNWPKIRSFNARHFHNYAAQLAHSLPNQPSVVLSDDVYRLYAVAALLGREGRGQRVLLDTVSLNEPAYHTYLRKKYGERIPALPEDGKIAPVPSAYVMQVLLALRKTAPAYYLHPSFGFFFETFFQQPHELVYRLEELPADGVEPPVPPPQLISRQAELWSQINTTALQPIKAERARLLPNRVKSHRDAIYAGQTYSQALDFWGVELQRAGRFDDAAKIFELALDVNPDNASAFINRESNQQWRTARKRLPRLSTEAEEKLQLYPGGFEPLLRANGPVDEPSFNVELAERLIRGGLPRQAAQLITRALSYAPDETSYKLLLANSFIAGNQPDRALALIAGARTNQPVQSLSTVLQMELVRTEASAQFARRDFETAEKLLQSLAQRFPQEDLPFATLSQFYVTRAEQHRQAGDTAKANATLTNALQVADEQVRRQPQNAAAYFNHGILDIHLSNYEGAITNFSRTLELQPKNFAALLNRAITNLRAQKWEAARRDYEALLQITATDFHVYYGLGEIAYHDQEWRKARDYYKKYLEYKPSIPAEVKFIQDRLREVKKKL